MALVEHQGDHTFDKSGFGVCVIDLTQGILFQNQACRSICKCPLADCPLTQGHVTCPLANLTNDLAENALHVLRAQELGGHFCDIVYFKENGREYRLIFPLNAKIEGIEGLVKEHQLTPRELEIASFVIVGMTNERICQRIGISRNTLRTHLKSIYRKVPPATRKLLGPLSSR